jgi:hypothetical protein
MEWWQIVLILLGSAIIGILAGFVLARLIRRFAGGRVIGRRGSKPFIPSLDIPRHEAALEVGEQRQPANAALREQEDRQKIGMVPLFSRRTITVLAIGLVIGVGLALAYWAVSPINLGLGWPPIEVEGHEQIYESKVRVGLMASGSSSQSLQNLRQQGEYYVSKMDTPHFWQFASEKIAADYPQYSRSAEELEQMVSIKYDWNSSYPAVEIRAISPYDDEAFFLASYTSQFFEEYLVADEKNRKEEEYAAKVAEMNSVHVAFVEANNELTQLRLESINYELEFDPEYVTLSKRVSSLEALLNSLADELSVLYAQRSDIYDEDGEKRQEWEILADMDRVSVALSSVKSELAVIEAQNSFENIEKSVVYYAAENRVKRLRNQYSSLVQEVTLLASNMNQPEEKAYFVREEPTLPVALAPARIRGRNAVMMGAVLGIGGAWVLLNRRWLTSGLLSYSGSTTEMNKDDEA